jgi:hypothetical protein
VCADLQIVDFLDVSFLLMEGAQSPSMEKSVAVDSYPKTAPHS